MSVNAWPASTEISSRLCPTGAPPSRSVVAVVVERNGRIALFKRSRSVSTDRSLWHCISGFIESGNTPKQQAFEELFEESGLRAGDLLALREGPALVLADDLGYPWLVHTFRAVSGRYRLRVNWEHESYRWTRPEKTRRFINRVAWLDTVLEATEHLKTCSRIRPRRLY